MDKIRNFIKEHKKPFIVIGIVILIVAFLIFIFYGIPRFLDRCVFSNSVPSALENGEWAGFLGSYLGGVLGGLCTLVTVLVTVRINQKQLLKAEQEKLEEERKKGAEAILSHTLGFISDIEKLIDRLTDDRRLLKTANKEVSVLEVLEKHCNNIIQNFQDPSWETLSEQLKSFYSGSGSASDVLEIAREYWDEYLTASSERNYKLKFEEFLKKKRQELEHAVMSLEIDDAELRKQIVGNIHYVYLEIMCPRSYSGLWDAIEKLYEAVLKDGESERTVGFRNSFEQKITAVKDALRKSLTEENPRDASESQ